MKIRIILICFLLVPASIFAQKWQQVYKGQNHFSGIHFINQNTVFAVSGAHANENNFRKSEDGGKTWETISLSTEEGLEDIYFLDEKVGYIVGDDAVIFCTNDGGKTWSKQFEKINQQQSFTLKAVHFANKNVGIAVGGNGFMVRTDDGGKTWKEVKLEGISTFYTVCFVNENTAFAGAIENKFIKSTDGGKTWKEIENPANRSIKAIEFVSEKVGFAVGGSGTILRTDDGGETWQKLTAKDKYKYDFTKDFYGLYCADEQNVFCISENGYVFYTKDGGKTWNFDELRGVLWDINGFKDKAMVIGSDNGLLYYYKAE